MRVRGICFVSATGVPNVMSSTIDFIIPIYYKINGSTMEKSIADICLSVYLFVYIFITL